MNTKVKVNLNNVESIKKFVQVARHFRSDIDIITERAHVDAKSILGLYTIDLSQETYVNIISGNESEIKEFIAAMEEFR